MAGTSDCECRGREVIRVTGKKTRENFKQILVVEVAAAVAVTTTVGADAVVEECKKCGNYNNSSLKKKIKRRRRRRERRRRRRSIRADTPCQCRRNTTRATGTTRAQISGSRLPPHRTPAT